MLGEHDASCESGATVHAGKIRVDSPCLRRSGAAERAPAATWRVVIALRADMRGRCIRRDERGRGDRSDRQPQMRRLDRRPKCLQIRLNSNVRWSPPLWRGATAWPGFTSIVTVLAVRRGRQAAAVPPDSARSLRCAAAAHPNDARQVIPRLLHTCVRWTSSRTSKRSVRASCLDLTTLVTRRWLARARWTRDEWRATSRILRWKPHVGGRTQSPGASAPALRNSRESC